MDLEASESPQYAMNTPPEITVYDFGVDIIANILTYLEPVETYTFLSTPLSKEFQLTYNFSQDLWRVLCLSGPFYAKKVDADAADEGQKNKSDKNTSSYPGSKNIRTCTGVKERLVGDYRSLYSSMIKCVLYLNRVKEDIRNGRTPSGAYDYDIDGSGSGSAASAKNYEDDNSLLYLFAKMLKMKKSDSSLQVLSSGAIDSIVNWMVALTDVLGIQIMCLKVLPNLLVNEQQRASAQHAGLTDVVVKAMVLFPNVVELHTAAFHALALLARPLGGKEGMMFNHSTIVNMKASSIFNDGSNSTTSTGESASITIMLDSMKRFVDNADLMAMSCWSMVNIALIPSQKVVLVRLGGISAAVHAMLHHPKNAEVQFRALFALINLVIPPSENLVAENSVEAGAIESRTRNHQGTGTKMLDDSIAQVINLAVVAMQNFCFSEPILTKACLVLHNLSLNKSNHRVLLLTPNCYQMLQWCIGNYKSDEVVQRGARDTLTRLQMTLSSDPTLRVQLTAAVREQRRYIIGEKIGTSPEVLQLEEVHNKCTIN